VGNPRREDTLTFVNRGARTFPTNLTQGSQWPLSTFAKRRGKRAASEAVATNDVVVAFAALEVELMDLLGRIAEVRANEGLREDNPEKADHLREEVAAGTKSANAAIDKTQAPIPTPPNVGVVETPRKRSWWRRLVPRARRALTGIVIVSSAPALGRPRWMKRTDVAIQGIVGLRRRPLDRHASLAMTTLVPSN
jgi:hypothetical protein